MNQDRWQRVKELLDAAITVPATERTWFLNQLNDPELRSENDS